MPQGHTNSNSLTPATKRLDNLFKSLIILQNKPTSLFCNEVSQFDATQPQELEDFYHTVRDQDGVLSLQFKNSQQMQTTLKFLSAKAWGNNKAGAL